MKFTFLWYWRNYLSIYQYIFKPHYFSMYSCFFHTSWLISHFKNLMLLLDVTGFYKVSGKNFKIYSFRFIFLHSDLTWVFYRTIFKVSVLINLDEGFQDDEIRNLYDLRNQVLFFFLFLKKSSSGRKSFPPPS